MNKQKLKKNRYDLCINSAALHNISYLDHLLRQVHYSLREDGYFVSNDYIGPHRNQYPYDQMVAMDDLNESLPKIYQKNLSYPHMPTMLATDPSEAIHSELIMEYVKRYFDIIYYVPYGGCLAYEILNNNFNLHRNQHRQEKLIKKIKLADEEYTKKTSNTLFGYFIAKKKKLLSTQNLKKYTLEEELRETDAKKKKEYITHLTICKNYIYS